MAQPLNETRGFSLLELVIVVAVIGVLLTIAVPTYRQYAQRAERADAIRVILTVAGCQERIRSVSGWYDTSQCLDDAVANNYRLRIAPPDNALSSAFTVFADPELSEDNSCGTLSLDHNGTRGISLESGSLQSCWGGR